MELKIPIVRPSASAADARPWPGRYLRRVTTTVTATAVARPWEPLATRSLRRTTSRRPPCSDCGVAPYVSLLRAIGAALIGEALGRGVCENQWVVARRPVNQRDYQSQRATAGALCAQRPAELRGRGCLVNCGPKSRFLGEPET